MQEKLSFGIIGLGKMGSNLALQAMEKGYKVIGYDKNEFVPELKKSAIVHAAKVEEFKEDLKTPRIIFLYIPAGKVVDIVINQIADVLDKNDIIVDGGNSYWGDSIRREERLKEKGINFIDCGTSGGVSGARNGACFMVGGDEDVVKKVEPIFKDLAVPEGYVYAGPSGSGHFVKLVHNGIEFGMLQAIGEGMDLLEKYFKDLNISEVLHCWNHGSVIRSWLVELMEQMYKEKNGLSSIPPYIEDTGEVNWLIDDALKMEVPVPVMAQSVMQLFASRDDKRNWARAIAMMRHGFGGHPFGTDEGIKHERKFGRVGDFYPNEHKEKL
ncbi:MAG: phosphogluconate dehydrogenase (NAD(+)-dependent, decarboxylating) [Syntrophothermus sp.]